MPFTGILHFSFFILHFSFFILHFSFFIFHSSFFICFCFRLQRYGRRRDFPTVIGIHRKSASRYISQLLGSQAVVCCGGRGPSRGCRRPPPVQPFAAYGGAERGLRQRVDSQAVERTAFCPFTFFKQSGGKIYSVVNILCTFAP